MEIETEILTRRILFEKSPLRIQIHSNLEYEGIDSTWYIQHGGFIFECERKSDRIKWPNGPKLYLVCKNVTTGDILTNKFYLDPIYCKILSGY